MLVKKLTSIILTVVCVAVVFLSVFVCPKKINEQKISNQVEYKGVLSIWQIDGFEGGKGSRKKFLLNVSREFEKKNQGVYFMVTNHTVESAEQNFKKGIFPDIVSYSYGLNLQNAYPLEEIKNLDLNMAKLNGKVYAYPWCMGGYFLFFLDGNLENPPREIENLTVSQNAYGIPLLALSKKGVSIKNLSTLKPLEAYIDFAYYGKKVLLGTQRDIFRLKNKGVDFKSFYLDGYCDLIQYVSVLTDDKERQRLSQDFCKFLMSESVQKRLNEIGMSSMFMQNDKEYQELEAIKYENQIIPNVFLASEKIAQIQNQLTKDKINDSEYVNKIKNIIN